jgi:hypothetical protein
MMRSNPTAKNIDRSIWIHGFDCRYRRKYDREHVTFAALTLNPSPKRGEGLQSGSPSPVLGEGVGG